MGTPLTEAFPPSLPPPFVSPPPLVSPPGPGVFLHCAVRVARKEEPPSTCRRPLPSAGAWCSPVDMDAVVYLPFQSIFVAPEHRAPAGRCGEGKVVGGGRGRVTRKTDVGSVAEGAATVAMRNVEGQLWRTWRLAWRLASSKVLAAGLPCRVLLLLLRHRHRKNPVKCFRPSPSQVQREGASAKQGAARSAQPQQSPLTLLHFILHLPSPSHNSLQE